MQLTLESAQSSHVLPRQTAPKDCPAPICPAHPRSEMSGTCPVRTCADPPPPSLKSLFFTPATPPKKLAISPIINTLRLTRKCRTVDETVNTNPQKTMILGSEQAVLRCFRSHYTQKRPSFRPISNRSAENQPLPYFTAPAGAAALAFAISGSFSAFIASLPCLLSGS